MRLAILPARGGSKRIPRKNIRPLAGKPAIAWPIEAAVASGIFDTVVVSTDNEEIADVARQHGAEAPFVRPPHLADDQATTRQVITHAIEQLGSPAGITFCIYPTAVLITAEDIRTAASLFEASDGANSVVSVASVDPRLWRAFAAPNLHLERLFPQHATTRSQDLPALFVDAGQFYVASNSHWLSSDRSLVQNGIPFVLPPERAIDVDTEADWQRLATAFQELKGQKSEAGE